MASPRYYPSRRLGHSFCWALACGSLLQACGASGPQYTKRIVEEPGGRSHTQGAQRNTTYSANVGTEHNLAHITVFETSVCDVIEFEILHRVEETYEGDELIERKNLGPRQHTTGVRQTMPCDERFARVPVVLELGGHSYPLGQTDPRGELHVDLAEAIDPATRGIPIADEAVGVLKVGDQIVGTISMAGLAGQQRRLDQIMAELEQLLGKDHLDMSDAEGTRAYVLHEQLLRIGGNDPRTLGLHERFVEVATGRAQEAKLQNLKRNLEAWNEARELVKDLASVVPSYVVVDVRREKPSSASLIWAQGILLHAIRANPALCGLAAALDAAAASALDSRTRLALQYLRYFYGSGYGAWLGRAC